MRYRIDAIHGEYASMAQYQWICRLFPRLRYYMTEHDVTTQSYERRVKQEQGLKKDIFLTKCVDYIIMKRYIVAVLMQL